MQEDTTALLWDHLFRCRVSQLETTSKTYLQFHGTPTTGDRDIDRTLQDQLIDTYLPIWQMAAYHRDGIAVHLLKAEDTKTIYDYVDRHLRAWRKQLDQGLNIGGAPIADLVALDNYANSVFLHARHVTTSTEAESPFMRYLSGLNLNANSMFKKTPTVKDLDEDNWSKRKPMADVFKSADIGTSNWRL